MSQQQSSQHYREAMRRAKLMARARTPLGHYWQQKQLVEALKALLAAPKGIPGDAHKREDKS